jgi:hypothetical protein
MNKQNLGKLAMVALALVAGLTHSTKVNAQGRGIVGDWQGSRSERNPINGQTFTVNFTFRFTNDGTYEEQASFGNWVILKLSGEYALSSARNPADPTVSAILRLIPQSVQSAPNDQSLMLLQVADIPATNPTDHFVTFFNVAPLGGMSLKRTAGGETWGLNRVR